jgi:hypothetical protein
MRVFRLGASGRRWLTGAVWLAAVLFAWVTTANAVYIAPLGDAEAHAHMGAAHGQGTHPLESGDARHDHGFSCEPCKTLLGIALIPMVGVTAAAPVFARVASDPLIEARARRSRDRGFLALPRGPPPAARGRRCRGASFKGQNRNRRTSAC